MHSVGAVARLSQALRIGATRTREEIRRRESRRVARRCAMPHGRHPAWSRQRGRTGGLDDASATSSGLHGTCNVTGTSVTWASAECFDTLRENKEVVINGVRAGVDHALTCGTDATTSTTADGLLLVRHGQTDNLPFKLSDEVPLPESQPWSCRTEVDWSVQIEGQTVTDSMYEPGRGAEGRWTSCRDPLPSLLFRVLHSGRRGPDHTQVQASANASAAVSGGVDLRYQHSPTRRWPTGQQSAREIWW